jgi:tRNA pseudouridine32 synthase/23S rRNA pseudouridine746 synthase
MLDAPPSPIHADDALLAFNKPSGMLCVPGRGPDKQDCLSTRAVRDWPQARVVHRLDQATSGLVVMALGLHWQRALSRMFEMRQINKTYLAAVAGRVTRPDARPLQEQELDWQTIDLPIGPDWPQRPRQQVDRLHGRASQTRWRLLDQQAIRDGPPTTLLPTIQVPHTWLEVEPQTGRTHQIRVHLAATGMPILGDALYASGEIAQGAPRLMLHAWRLSFTHPLTGRLLALQAPM